jgi:hypothetical protein
MVPSANTPARIEGTVQWGQLRRFALHLTLYEGFVYDEQACMHVEPPGGWSPTHNVVRGLGSVPTHVSRG